MMNPNINRILPIVAVCFYVVTGDIMNDLHYYETMKLSDITARVRRSADPDPSSHLHEIKFFTLGRYFHMYLKQSEILSHDFKASIVHGNGSNVPFEIDRTKFMSGTLRGRHKRSLPYVGTHTVCRLALVADHYFYDGIGGGNEHRTAEYLIGMINNINNIYTKTSWPDDTSSLKNLGFEIAEVEVHNEPTQTIWIGNGRIAVNTGVSSYKNPGSNTRALTSQAIVTTAHAHNWGSEHDPDTNQCSPKAEEGGKFIMYPRATSGSQTNNQIFSPCSKRFMFQVIRNKGFNCFSTPQNDKLSLCGNTRLEKGEECDAGYQGDACCNSRCELKPNAICSPMNYVCCQDCKKAPKDTPCLEKIDDNIDCKSSSKCKGNCKNGICEEFCLSRGEIPCICTDEKYECRRCCRVTENSPCNAYGDYVQDSRPCSRGYCQSGVCKEVKYSFIKRLFPIIESFTVSAFVEFLKNNIVWTVLVLSVTICDSIWDVKKARKDKEALERMITHRNKTILERDRNNISRPIRFAGTWNRG
ncbi:hypothetical protein KUTeg_004998 [Tegillarca granosa]|uniref:Uncharacterized protein n=1 Tax=Tegillarca granosa TaxID=220873 RepID=A0ABQ9FII1_TEGGR|nr:hypothetical protein KUTeg_004998 [Tegillarca granosa]